MITSVWIITDVFAEYLRSSLFVLLYAGTNLSGVQDSGADSELEMYNLHVSVVISASFTDVLCTVTDGLVWEYSVLNSV